MTQMSSTLRSAEVSRHILDVIIAQTGLSSLNERISDFDVSLQRRMESLSLGSAIEYQQLFDTEDKRVEELEYFTRELTIGETYFFRHPEVLDTFKEILESEYDSGERVSIRVWSAACSTGCEPYTLGILLREFCLERPEVDFKVYASDINSKCLDDARSARYSKWSLRNMEPDRIEKYFRQSGSQYVLRPYYREGVEFFQHNLISGPPDRTLGAHASLDAIFCRNVLIYFDLETTARLIRQFYEMLRPGGWLVLGPSESNSLIVSGFEVIQSPHAVIYRKPCGGKINRERRARSPYQPYDLSGVGLKTRSKPEVKTVSDARELPPMSRTSKVGLNAMIQDRLFSNAYRELLKQIELNELDPHLHLLAGYVAQESGLMADVEPHYRKAIYLDRKSIPAHYLYAVFLLLKKSSARAKKECEVSLRLLHEAVSDAIELPTERIDTSELIGRIEQMITRIDELG